MYEPTTLYIFIDDTCGRRRYQACNYDSNNRFCRIENKTVYLTVFKNHSKSLIYIIASEASYVYFPPLIDDL